MKTQVHPVAEELYENIACQDHRDAVGSVILVDYLTAYRGDTDNQDAYHFDPPLAVRVLPAEPGDLAHWVDEWLDPYWDVEVVDRSHPQLPPEGLRGAYVYGTSYNGVTGDEQGGPVRFETFAERWARRWRLLRRRLRGR
jgi:hypothetical protein